MLKIDEIRIENLIEGCITDNCNPVFSFSLLSEKQDTYLVKAVVKVGDWQQTVYSQKDIIYTGVLIPFTMYIVDITAYDNHGEIAVKTAYFQTGRMKTIWDAKWITKTSYTPEKKKSPIPMTFEKKFKSSKQIKRAYMTVTAMGIFEINLNGNVLTQEYFAPGFTSYKHTLQYVFYDITDYINLENKLIAVVGGGWAVGRFTYSSKSQITTKRQMLLAEMFFEYADGSFEKIVTDETWKVTLNGNYRFGDFYDGETFDSTIKLDSVSWESADTAKLKFKPKITARYGCPVKAHETLLPVNVFVAINGEVVYDFGQNFAGVIHLKINGRENQKIVIRHAEILCKGNLSVKSLRTAKATVTYICSQGEQIYSPKLTYMGFRYVGIRGIERKDINVSAFAIYSDIEAIGAFECSNPLINKLQSNIVWSSKSNFVDIPTDCPQRDERQGWTGDISVFSRTACYNFDLSRFLGKWLADVRYEQGKLGGIPFIVPRHGDIWPVIPTACWSDGCILVPWAEYLARGSKTLLKKQYPVMKKYLKAVKFWASLFSFSKDQKKIWKYLFQFGDWCAPDGYIKDWMKKGKWIATAYYANSCNIMAKISDILGYAKDKEYYNKLSTEICTAYINVFTNGDGKLDNEFQTAYVLPIYFNMTDESTKLRMANNLERLVKERDYHLSTGFTGTPYLLFALSDNNKVDVAYKLLMQDTCPSWIYQVKHGATTFWEQWCAVSPDNEEKGLTYDESDSEASFNHYAYGAVGDFLYRRIAGIEATSGGYETFSIKPVIGGNLIYAKSSQKTPYGTITSKWEISNDIFSIDFTVPVSTKCTVTLPNGKTANFGSGKYTLSEKINYELQRNEL